MTTVFELSVVSTGQAIPADPDCSPCAIKRRLIPWPYPATGAVTVEFDDIYNINPPEWEGNKAYQAGDLVMPTTLTPENAGIYQAVASGTSGSSEPQDWPRFHPGITSSNFTGYFSWTPTVSDVGLLWYKRYHIRARENHILRIIKPEHEPAPTHVYNYEVFMQEILNNYPYFSMVAALGGFGDGFATYRTSSDLLTMVTGDDQDIVLEAIFQNPTEYTIEIGGVLLTYDGSTNNYSNRWWADATYDHYFEIANGNFPGGGTSHRWYSGTPSGSAPSNFSETVKIYRNGVLEDHTVFDFKDWVVDGVGNPPTYKGVAVVTTHVGGMYTNDPIVVVDQDAPP